MANTFQIWKLQANLIEPMTSQYARTLTRKYLQRIHCYSVVLLPHRQVLLGFVHAASEDGVGARTREILVFSR